MIFLKESEIQNKIYQGTDKMGNLINIILVHDAWTMQLNHKNREIRLGLLL